LVPVPHSNQKEAWELFGFTEPRSCALLVVRLVAAKVVLEGGGNPVTKLWSVPYETP
jgi:hypothetical protein